MHHASRIVGLVLAALSLVTAAAAQPHELVSVDPLRKPLPPLLHTFRAEPSAQPPEERIVPRLWQRVAEVGPEGELSVIVLLREPVIARANALTPEDLEAARVAAIAHLAHGFADRARAVGLREARGFSHLPIVVGTITARELPQLATDVAVEAIQEDEIVFAMRTQGGSLIRAPQMRSLSGATGAGIGIAIVDSGVAAHPEFGVRLAVGANFTNEPGGPTNDGSGHGTKVAGITSGSAGGMAPASTIWALKVLKSDGTGLIQWSINALNALFAERNNPEFGGLHVVNMSLGGSSKFNSTCDAASPAFAAAVNQLVDAGIAVFAASGNDGFLDGISQPACISGAIAVGAVVDAALNPDPICGGVSAADDIACYSNSGHPLDILAPSHCATTTQPGGGLQQCFNGTSAASPYAAGVAALLLEAWPNTTPAQLRSALRASGKPITDVNGITRNRIDAVDAYNDLAPSTAPCQPDAFTLCLDNQPGDKRFKVEIYFETSQAGGVSGFGRAIPLSSLGVNRGGLFWFFNADNPELLIKVLNGCGHNNHFWIFFSAGTNVGMVLRVTDTHRGLWVDYFNPDLNPVPTVQHTSGIPCT